MKRSIHGIEVYGLDLDGQSRCAHWRSPLDIVAIRFKCCGRYFACRACHDALADHRCEVWPREAWDGPAAVLCGNCGRQMSVREYLACDATCPGCAASFNPGCARHHHLYFETEL